MNYQVLTDGVAKVREAQTRVREAKDLLDKLEYDLLFDILSLPDHVTTGILKIDYNRLDRFLRHT